MHVRAQFLALFEAKMRFKRTPMLDSQLLLAISVRRQYRVARVRTLLLRTTLRGQWLLFLLWSSLKWTRPFLSMDHTGLSRALLSLRPRLRR